jgi:uncharacterized delta-60 repeat protein
MLNHPDSGWWLHMVFVSHKFIFVVLLLTLIMCFLVCIVTHKEQGTSGVNSQSSGSSVGGNLIWTKNVEDESGHYLGAGITTLSDDSIAITGQFNRPASAEASEQNQTVIRSPESNNDIFIACYDQEGTLDWEKRVGGASAFNEGSGIAALSDNSIVITGSFGGLVKFGSGEPNETKLETFLTTAGFEDTDIFIACYNPDGTLAWAKSAGGVAGGDFGCRIATLSDDSIVVTGGFYESAIFGAAEQNQTTLTSAGGWDIFIARYYRDGTLAWAKRIGGDTDGDYSYGITALSDDSIVVTGYFDAWASFASGEPNETVLNSDGFEDIFIARYNPDGTFVWVKSAGGLSRDFCYGVTAMSDNSTVVTGQFTGPAMFGLGEPNYTVLNAFDDNDIFIARYNPDGTLAWAKSAGGTSGEDEGKGIATLSDDSIIITGGFSESAIFGPDEPNETSLNSIGKRDIFVARYNPDGTLNWVERSGGEYSLNWVGGITALSDNSVVVIGNSRSSFILGEDELNQIVLTSTIDMNMFIARFAP